MGNRSVKGIVVLGIWLAGIAVLPWAAFAGGFAQPTAEYSADRNIISEGSSFSGKVHAAPGKERMEIESGEAVTIMRMDKKLMWTLMPQQKQYMEFDFSEQKQEKRQKGDYRDCDVKQTEKGRETIDGFSTRKMTMEVSCPGDEKHSGTVWLTKENIPIRMEASKIGSKKETVRVELKNLKIGKQDPKLFEIPAGYSKMEMPSLRNIQEMMRKQQSMQEQAEKEAVEKEAAREAESAKRRQQQETGRAYTAQPRKESAEKSAVDKVIDPAKKLKSILGW